MTLEPSGPQWCERYPTSTQLVDLVEPFRSRAQAFVAALQAVGHVQVNATYRPAERAYLMHFAGMIAKSGQDPNSIPGMEGVGIDWTHGGDIAAARKAAELMMARYGIVYPAALVSRHTQGLAVDMNILIPAGNAIVGGQGAPFLIRTEADGEDPRVIACGASYGVIKFAYHPDDKPHWSSDGH